MFLYPCFVYLLFLLPRSFLFSRVSLVFRFVPRHFPFFSSPLPFLILLLTFHQSRFPNSLSSGFSYFPFILALPSPYSASFSPSFVPLIPCFILSHSYIRFTSPCLVFYLVLVLYHCLLSRHPSKTNVYDPVLAVYPSFIFFLPPRFLPRFPIRFILSLSSFLIDRIFFLSLAVLPCPCFFSSAPNRISADPIPVVFVSPILIRLSYFSLENKTLLVVDLLRRELHNFNVKISKRYLSIVED